MKMKVSGRFSIALAVAVAGKCRDVHRLAGAINAALGPGQDVDRAGRRAAGDAAVGEIEAGARHVEEDVVVVAVPGGDHGGRHGGACRASDRR